MTGTALAAPQTEEALALSARAGDGGLDPDFQIPRLKIGQGTTQEVADGDAARGDLIHGLTGQLYGTAVDLIVINTFKGRSWRNDETKKFYTAGEGEVTIPERWDHPDAGEFFVDHPDASEQFTAACNAKPPTREWGKGPPISTTYNFVCLIVGEDGEPEGIPVQVSLSKSSEKEGRNWLTMTNIGGAPWDKVYTLSTAQTTNKRDERYTSVKVKIKGRTAPEQRQLAVTASAFVQNAPVVYQEGSDEERPAAVQDTGGLGI